MALELYNVLINLTGAIDPNITNVQSTDPGFATARWLAQIAVNIVDFIDEDDYMTVWNWNANDRTTANPKDYVYGTELPQLLINEVYAQVDNDLSEMISKPDGTLISRWDGLES